MKGRAEREGGGRFGSIAGGGPCTFPAIEGLFGNIRFEVHTPGYRSVSMLYYFQLSALDASVWDFIVIGRHILALKQSSSSMNDMIFSVHLPIRNEPGSSFPIPTTEHLLLYRLRYYDTTFDLRAKPTGKYGKPYFLTSTHPSQ